MLIYSNKHEYIYKKPIKKYTNKVGLFCNARDEINIKEWASHHLIIGFDIIIIFGHKSKQPLKEIFKKIIDYYS
jgi:hypothetical protein